MKYAVTFHVMGTYDIDKTQAKNKDEADQLFCEVNFGKAENINGKIGQEDKEQYIYFVDATYTVEVDGRDIEDVIEKANEKFNEEDFGYLMNVEGEMIHMEDEHGVWVQQNDQPKEGFICYKDLSDIPDSMLIDSDTVIAEYIDPDNDLRVSLEVRGEVRVVFQGDVYCYPSEFPEELKDYIKENKGIYELPEQFPDSYISDNNWFELFIMDKNGQYITSDVVDCENQTPEEIKDMMKETLDDYLRDMEAEMEEQQVI